MTMDTRTDTGRAKRQLINRHVFKDHGEFTFERGTSTADRYAIHKALHEAGDCGHDHEDYNDLSDQYAHYVDPVPLRIRKERVPKKWSLTYHLASQHGERITGDDLAKLIFHGELHGEDGTEWAGDPLHRHVDIVEPTEAGIEYKENS